MGCKECALDGIRKTAFAHYEAKIQVCDKRLEEYKFSLILKYSAVTAHNARSIDLCYNQKKVTEILIECKFKNLHLDNKND